MHAQCITAFAVVWTKEMVHLPTACQAFGLAIFLLMCAQTMHGIMNCTIGLLCFRTGEPDVAHDIESTSA